MPRLDAPDRLLDLRSCLQSLLLYPRGQFAQCIEKTAFGVGDHGVLFLAAWFALAQYDPFRPLAIQIGGLWVFHDANPYRCLSFPALNNLEPMLLAKRFQITLALPPCVIDQVAKAVRTQKIQILARGHAGVQTIKGFSFSGANGGIQISGSPLSDSPDAEHRQNNRLQNPHKVVTISP